VKLNDPAREAVKRALAICGGARLLCARLGVSATRLQAWLDGEEIPRAQLLKIIEVVLADYDAWRAQDRRSEPRARTRPPTRQPAGVL
jgi:hypothetical protein